MKISRSVHGKIYRIYAFVYLVKYLFPRSVTLTFYFPVSFCFTTADMDNSASSCRVFHGIIYQVTHNIAENAYGRRQ